MVEKGEPQFLRNISNPDLIWQFELVGHRVIVACVINYEKTTQGIPITLYVQQVRLSHETGKHVMDYKPMDIPWTIIQTIRPIKREQ